MANANLFQQFLQPVRSVTDYAADLDKAEGNQLALQGQRRQNELSALTADQTRQKISSDTEDRNALQRLAATWGADTTLDQRIASLRNSGRASLMQQADSLEKQGLEKQKVGAEVGEKQSKVMDETIKRYRTALDYVSTPQDAARWLQAQYSDPAISEHMTRLSPFEQAVARIPSDPQQFQQWRQQAGMGMEKFAENQRLLAQQAETERNNKAQVSATYAGIAERRESSKRTDKRERELNGTKGNATEGERNAAGYLMRMQEATKLLDQFEGSGSPSYGSQAAGSIPFVGSMARRAVMTPDQQQYRQAQEDWVRAKLRKESGASIASDEMDREIETYFPMPGESPQVIAQKRKSRLVANDAFRSSAGRAAGAQTQGSQSESVVDFGSLK